MPIKLNILEPIRDQREDIIYNDIDLNVNVGVVRGDNAESKENLKDLNTSVNFEAIKNSL